MSFIVYKLCWDPTNAINEGHVALYVETAEEEAIRTVKQKRVTEKVQTGYMYHATDSSKKVVKDGDTEFMQFEFEKKPFTPAKSITLARMFAIGKLEARHLSTLPTIAKSVPHPKRPFPYTSRNKRPNYATWYMDFIRKLTDGNIVSLSGKEILVDRFESRKIASGTASGSSSASDRKKKLGNLFKRK